MTAVPATPDRWIGRLALLNAAVLVVLGTLLTDPALTEALRFDPTAPANHPWAVVTYPFVHQGVVHLAAVLALLWTLAPAVARRMGTRAFLAYYLYCALGAAGFAVGLSTILPQPPLAGGLAPALGMAVARGWYAEDEEVVLDPLPITVRVRTLLGALIVVAALAGLIVHDSSLSAAHLGGVLAGVVFFRVQALTRRSPTPAVMPIRRPVMAPIHLQADGPAAHASEPARTSAPGQPGDTAAPDTEEVNRVLDKISAHGIDSLTQQERLILTQFSEHKRQERS